LKCKIYYKKIW